MAHDIHFLERLRRLDGPQVELAMSLYQNAPLVKAILASVKLPEDQSRVAIALDGSDQSPHVLVERSGHFVTCLASGMQHDLPLVTREAVDRAASANADLREKLRAAKAMEGTDAFLRRVQRIFDGPRLTREEFTDIYSWAPALGGSIMETQLAASRRLLILNATLRHKERLRERDQGTVRQYWREIWLLQHLLLPYAGVTHRRLDWLSLDLSRGEKPVPKTPHARRILARFTSPPPFLRLQFAGIWTVTFLLPATLRGVRASLMLDDSLRDEARQGYLEGGTKQIYPAALVLTAWGVKDPSFAGQATATLEEDPHEGGPADDEDRRFRAYLMDVMARPREAFDRAYERAKAWLSSVVGDVSGVATADILAASACRPLVVNKFEPLLEMADLIPFVVASEPAGLFTPAKLLARFPPEDLDAEAVAYVEAIRSGRQKPSEPPTPAPPKLGRNDLCHCGSGKKFKKCHGA